MALADMPRLDDGTVDFRRLATSLDETVVDVAMVSAADGLIGEANRRNGHPERKRRIVIGEIAISPQIPEARGGVYFPENVVRPCTRTDKAMTDLCSEVYRLRLSTRKTGRTAANLGLGRLTPSTVSQMTVSLNGDVEEVVAAAFNQGLPRL